MVRLILIQAIAFLVAAAPMPSVKYTVLSSSRVLKATFSPDSKLIACGSFDKKVRIYSVEGRSAADLLFTFDDARHRVFSVAFSPDSKLFVSGAEDKKLRIYDLKWAGSDTLKKWPLRCTLGDAMGRSFSVAFSGSQTPCPRLAGFSVASRRPRRKGGPKAPLHPEDTLRSVSSLSFDWEFKFLASGSFEKMLRVDALED